MMSKLSALGKKKKAADNERISVLENARKQHNYHIGRLEQMLRLLDNNDLAPDQASPSAYLLVSFVGCLKRGPRGNYSISICSLGLPRVVRWTVSRRAHGALELPRAARYGTIEAARSGRDTAVGSVRGVRLVLFKLWYVGTS